MSTDKIKSKRKTKLPVVKPAAKPEGPPALTTDAEMLLASEAAEAARYAAAKAKAGHN